LGVSHERWWFIARLFAAWAAIIMAGDFVLLALSPLASTLLALFPLGPDDALRINGQSDLWWPAIYKAFTTGWVYFIVAYLVADLFVENSAKVGAGIFLVGMSYNILYRVLSVVSFYAHGAIEGPLFSWDFLWTQEFAPIRLAGLAYSAIVLGFAFAGALLNRFVPKSEFGTFLRRIRRWQ
jgi:hypothetical protein